MSQDIISRVSPSRGAGSPRVVGFYEPDTGSCQYICVDEETKKCALIDIVQQFDPRSFSTAFDHAQWALDYVEREGSNWNGSSIRTPTPITSWRRPG